MKRLLQGFFIFFFIVLAACSRINQTNFDKIQNGMNMKDVVAILGEPTKSESVNIAGISATTAAWNSKNGVINIQLINDRVQIKSFDKQEQKLN